MPRVCAFAHGSGMISYDESVDRAYIIMGHFDTQCLITRSKKIHDAAMLFAQARLSPVLLGQIAATAAHQNDTAYILKVREEYTNRRNLLVELLNSIPGVVCPKPKGAFYCVAELPVDDTDEFAQWLLESYSHNNETVMVAPMSGFYSPRDLNPDP